MFSNAFFALILLSNAAINGPPPILGKLTILVDHQAESQGLISDLKYHTNDVLACKAYVDIEIIDYIETPKTYSIRSFPTYRFGGKNTAWQYFERGESFKNGYFCTPGIGIQYLRYDIYKWLTETYSADGKQHLSFCKQAPFPKRCEHFRINYRVAEQDTLTDEEKAKFKNHKCVFFTEGALMAVDYKFSATYHMRDKLHVIIHKQEFDVPYQEPPPVLRHPMIHRYPSQGYRHKSDFEMMIEMFSDEFHAVYGNCFVEMHNMPRAQDESNPFMVE